MANARPLKILYVEDHPDIREAMTDILSDDGHTVTPCPSAAAALAALEADGFDLLLTDVSLPDLSGIELARSAVARRAKQWVVFCSGYELGAGVSEIGANVRAASKSGEPEVLLAMIAEIGAALLEDPGVEQRSEERNRKNLGTSNP